MPRHSKFAGGLTLVELVIAMLVSTLVASAVGIVMVDGYNSWARTYVRAYSDVVSGGLAAKRAFEKTVRNASCSKVFVGDNGEWIEFRGYSSASCAKPDCYSRFYTADETLQLETGTIEPRLALSWRTVCGQVSGCTFTTSGRSAQMILTLEDDESEPVVFTASAVMLSLIHI